MYKKYLEEHKEELEKRQLEEQLQTDAVVVKKLTVGAKAAQLSVDIIITVLKIIATVIVLALLSLAVTVLLNEPLRKLVFEYMRMNGYIN